MGAEILSHGHQDRVDGRRTTGRRDSARARVQRGISGLGAFFRMDGGRRCSQDHVESVGLSGTGTDWGEVAAPWLHAITVLIVVVLTVYGSLMWRRGVLDGLPEVQSLGARTVMVVSVGVWLAFATLPYWWE